MVNWKLTLYWNNPKLPRKLQFQFEQLLRLWNNYYGLWSWIETWACSWLWNKRCSQSNWAWDICMECSFRIFIHRQVTRYEDDIRTAQRRGLLGIMNLRFFTTRREAESRTGWCFQNASFYLWGPSGSWTPRVMEVHSRPWQEDPHKWDEAWGKESGPFDFHLSTSSKESYKSSMD